MKMKFVGMMMALMCLVMMGGASATTVSNSLVANDSYSYYFNSITINITNPSIYIHCVPVYDARNVILRSHEIQPSTEGSVETFRFEVFVGQKIIMDQYESGTDVPIATSAYYIRPHNP